MVHIALSYFLIIAVEKPNRRNNNVTYNTATDKSMNIWTVMVVYIYFKNL